MFALIVAVSTLSFVAAPPQDPATLLPPDTMFYTGTDSMRAGSQAAKASAMHMIFNEPEVKAFLAKPLSILDRVLDQAAEQQGFDEPPFTMSQFVFGDGDGPPIGRMFIALTHVSLDMESGEAPDIGLVVGVEMLSEGDLGMVKGLWEMIPSDQVETSYDGHAVFSKSPPGKEDMAARLTFLDNMAVASLSSKSIEAVIDRYSSNSVGGSLADSRQYQRLLEVAGGLHGGGSVTYMEPASMAGLLRTGMATMLTMEGKSEMIPKVTGLIDSLGLDAFTGLGSASYRDGSGLVHSTSVLFRDPAATGLLPEMVGDLQPLDLSRLEGLPGNSMSASAP